MSRFDYVQYDEKAKAEQELLKQQFVGLEATIGLMQSKAPMPALMQLNNALAALEVAYMWVGKYLRDEQIARNGYALMQEERTNS